MDVEKAIETEIERRLREVFGFSTARSVLTMGTLAYVTTAGPRVQRYRALVDSICADDRVVQKWGQAAAARQAREWKDLVPARHRNFVILTPIAS
jgi:hypothetical protein